MPSPETSAIRRASASTASRIAASFAASGERMSTVNTARPGITLREFGCTVAWPTAPTASGWCATAI